MQIDRITTESWVSFEVLSRFMFQNWVKVSIMERAIKEKLWRRCREFSIDFQSFRFFFDHARALIDQHREWISVIYMDFHNSRFSVVVVPIRLRCGQQISTTQRKTGQKARTIFPPVTRALMKRPKLIFIDLIFPSEASTPQKHRSQFVNFSSTVYKKFHPALWFELLIM